jgi:hypothetical protein
MIDVKTSSYHQCCHDRAMDDAEQMGFYTQPAAENNRRNMSIQMHFINEYINLKITMTLTCHCSTQLE